MNYAEFATQFHINMNEQQKVAIQATEGPVLLLAVPGSGKTTVLVNRLGYMIIAKGIRPENILTVTYTVAATADMKRRFRKRFGDEYAERLEFRTINGISQKILQYYGNLTGKRPFGIADKETVAIMKRLFRDKQGVFVTELELRNFQTAITYVKNMCLNRKEIEEFETDVNDFPEMYDAYNKELRRLRLIDYDDQMVYALQILTKYPQVLDFFQNRYLYICLDEAQDTSKIQHDMIHLLTGKSGNLFMVGDEDQSIYGFRAAYPEALVSFEQTHPGAKVLLMETNYRSTDSIVGIAASFITHNQNRYDKKMKAARENIKSESPESSRQVTAIPARSRKGQYTYLCRVAQNCDRETAVLYRNHESCLPLIDLLERENISYSLKKNDMTFFSHPVVTDIFDYISLALKPDDGEAFLRIYYKMGAGISKDVANEAVENNRHQRSLLEMVADYGEVSSFTRKQVRALSTHLKNMRMESAGKAVYRILNYMGYQDYMMSHGMDDSKAQILKLLGDNVDNLADFPERLAFLQELVAAGKDSDENRFVLSTIHASKGLEYERVYLMDMMAGILPDGAEPKKNALTAERAMYEEERRLYYVAMTRAKDELFIFTFGEQDTSVFTREALGNEAIGIGRGSKRTYTVQQSFYTNGQSSDQTGLSQFRSSQNADLSQYLSSQNASLSRYMSSQSNSGSHVRPQKKK